MATATMDKSSRMDMRMSEKQRGLFERAAALKGQTLTQWSLTHLEVAAEQDILESTTMVLEPEAFEAFCAALEEPMPAAMKRLLETDDKWI